MLITCGIERVKEIFYWRSITMLVTSTPPPPSYLKSFKTPL